MESSSVNPLTPLLPRRQSCLRRLQRLAFWKMVMAVPKLIGIRVSSLEIKQRMGHWATRLARANRLQSGN